MNKKQKKVLIRIIVTIVLLIALRFIPIEGYVRMALYMVPYLVIGYDILKKAFKGIKNRQVFDENFLMAVATVGAIALGDYQEGTAVMLFYQIGELFQSYAVGKSRRNISELMDIRPDYANIEQDGKLEKVDPDEVEVGTVIVVQPGEKIPIDGIVEDNSIYHLATKEDMLYLNDPQFYGRIEIKFDFKSPSDALIQNILKCRVMNLVDACHKMDSVDDFYKPKQKIKE